jgi:hypothetical protein
VTAGELAGGASAPPADAKRSPALERVRAARKEIAKRNTLTLKIPGYEELLGEGNALLVRYKAVPGNTITKLAERMQKSDDEAAMKIAADIVIKCCDAILLREGFDAKPEPLDPTTDEPTTFETATLPDLLDFEAETAREEVFATFSPEGVQGLAVVDQASAIVKWLEGKVGEIDQELLGE